MKYIKIVFALLLFVTPIGLHTFVSSSSSTTYAMTPVGAIQYSDNKLTYTPYSFKWYSEDGRKDYFKDNWPDQPQTFASDYMSDVEISLFSGGSLVTVDFNLSNEGLFELMLPYLLIIYLILIFIPGGVGSLIGDIILVGTSVITLISYLDYVERSSYDFDKNFPVFPIVSLVFALLGMLLSIKTMNKKKGRRKRRK